MLQDKMSSKRIKSVPGGASKIRKKKSQEAETKRLSGSILQFVKITPKNLEENQNGDEQENENGDEQEKEQNNENGDGSDEQEKEQDNDNRDEQENEHDNENGDEQEKEQDNGNEQGEGRTFDAREYSIDGDINDPGSWPKVDDRLRVFLVEKGPMTRLPVYYNFQRDGNGRCFSHLFYTREIKNGETHKFVRHC